MSRLCGVQRPHIAVSSAAYACALTQLAVPHAQQKKLCFSVFSIGQLDAIAFCKSNNQEPRDVSRKNGNIKECRLRM